jgi:uncharacterized membrane protein YkoI
MAELFPHDFGGLMNRTLVATLAAGLLATPAVAQAPSGATGSSDGNGQAPTQMVPQTGPVLNETEIKARLAEEGYTEVTELQLQGPSYEAKALKDGRKYNLTVDARTGNIRSRY